MERNKIKQYEHECTISYAVCMVEHFSTRNDARNFCSLSGSANSCLPLYIFSSPLYVSRLGAAYNRKQFCLQCLSLRLSRGLV